MRTGEREKFAARGELLKVDASLGLVFGWAIVCKVDGKDYFDLQGDNIPEESMLEAATDFMLNSRKAKAMHEGGEVGPVVFAFPLTEDVKKAYGITCRKTGLMLAMKPGPDVISKFESGEYTGFSIGGWREEDEPVAE